MTSFDLPWTAAKGVALVVGGGVAAVVAFLVDVAFLRCDADGLGLSRAKSRERAGRIDVSHPAPPDRGAGAPADHRNSGSMSRWTMK